MRQRSRPRRLLGDFLFGILVVGLLGLAVVFGVGLTALNSRLNGELQGYKEGVTDGRAEVCAELLQQINYARDVERNLLASGKNDADTAAALAAEEDAALHDECGIATATQNIFDPLTTPPPLPVGSVTLPVSPVKTGCPACLLKGEPTPSSNPAPTPDVKPKHGR